MEKRKEGGTDDMAPKTKDGVHARTKSRRVSSVVPKLRARRGRNEVAGNDAVNLQSTLG